MNRVNFFVALICLLGITFNVGADARKYVWTYEYVTMPKQKAEIEYYYTTKIPDATDADINTMDHQIEFEYGITDHWDIALYQRFKQHNRKAESDFVYDAFKLRTRYRFGEKGQFILDPLLYIEYIRDVDFSKPHVLEAKVILAKDIGKFNIAYDQILKRVAEKEGKSEHEYALGLSYSPGQRLSLGLETKGNYSKSKYSLGPTVSYRFNKFWCAMGVVFGLNSSSDDIASRLIVGYPF